MTEEFVKQPSLESGSVPEPEGVGPTLRRLREARQLTRTEASMRLKFSKRQLEALENEQWDDLPQGMSLRGFVRNYARYLEADPDALLTVLDNQIGPPQSAFVSNDRAGRVTGTTSLDGPDDDVRRPWGWWLVIVAFVLVAAFYAIQRGWVPESWLIFDWLKSIRS